MRRRILDLSRILRGNGVMGTMSHYSSFLWYNQGMSKAEGYKSQQLFLDNAIENNKLAHAYLFCGPDNSAKLEFAKNFANKILGVENTERLNPDLIVVNEEKLKVEDIRNLISELSLKPFHYTHKVAIISNFEKVTDEAANSILKTLEEPNPSTILILLASNKLSVLATIASRCQAIYFNTQASGVRDEELQAIAKQSAAEKLVAVKDYADKETSELQTIFENWIEAEREKMSAGETKRYVNLQALLESLQGLKQNLNKKLILERLFLQLV